jgi:lysophospholipase L1-like esterase/dienelactone hydrolase
MNMKMRHLPSAWLLAALLTIFGTSQGQQRFRTRVFDRFDSAVDLSYRTVQNLKGEQEELRLDVLMPPAPDTLRRRPLVVLIHGGGFVNGNRKTSLIRRFCEDFAKRGYVSASISYRLGVAPTKTDNDYYEAMYRAQQDGRTAIRFLKRNAERFGIDTSQVFLMGTSAGAMTSLAVGYMDDHEVPRGVDRSRWGTLEGLGHEGVSSRVQAVVNLWGSLPDHRWIKTGDAPLFNTGGTADKTVPYDSSYSYHGIGKGPAILFDRCLSEGVPTGLRPFVGAGHTLDSDKRKLDTCLTSIADWMYTRLAMHGSSQGVRRWEKEIAAFDSLNAVERYRKGSLLFLGSSYIRMWKNIREDLGQPRIIHRGFGGSNLADVAYYVTRIVYPHKPKALFMYVGNDITAGERDKAPDQVLEHFKYVVRQVRAKYPTLPITWLEISPSERRWAAWDRVQEANRLIREYCATDPNLHVIAFAGSFLGPDGTPIKSLYLPDKLHYNEEGYRVWGRSIREQVAAIAR